MTNGYTGWKLFDKVTIVAKKIFSYDYTTWSNNDTGDVQGYVVDPSNKKQLESARRWGTRKEYIYKQNENSRTMLTETITHAPEEYTYDNNGFTLELQNSADDSSQGGKLSFWNCWITAPDGKRFLIGIAADLLLDVLKSSTVINGVVQDKLMFARNKGGVGMLSKSMDSYKNAVNDMATKKNMSENKTSNHQVGRVYETATEQNVYGGKFYRWYEPIFEWRTSSTVIVGIKRLEKPVEQVWFPHYSADKTKLSELLDGSLWRCRNKAPARRESNIVLEVDITTDDVVKKFEDYNFRDTYNKMQKGEAHLYPCGWSFDAIGLSSSSTEYTLPDDIRAILIKHNYRIED